MKRFIFATVALLLLSGCARTTLSSAWKLRNVRPETTNVRVLRIAAQIPKQFRFQPEGVVFVLQTRKERGQKVRREEFVLKRELVSQHVLADYRTSSSELYVYRIAARDAGRLNRFRKLIREKSLDVATMIWVKKVCRLRTGLPQSIPMSSFIKTEETKEFVPLALNVDLLDEMNRAQIRKIAPVCKKR